MSFWADGFWADGFWADGFWSDLEVFMPSPRLLRVSPEPSCKKRIFKDCILSGEALDFSIDWTLEFANRWQPNSNFISASRIRPSTFDDQTGYEYESSGGQSDGDTEPQWPLSGTVTDGPITWTARALSLNSYRERISSVTWSAPSNFTITDESSINTAGAQIASARISAAARNRSRQDIKCEVTTTLGNVYVVIIRMRVE